VQRARGGNRRTLSTPPQAGEGRVGDGAPLGPIAHAACESARILPERFAHPSACEPASITQLWDEPFPGDIASPMASMKPKSASKALRRRPLPRKEGEADEPPANSQQAESQRPVGNIRIEELFLGDVYALEVLTWLTLADTAAAAIRAGRRPPKVPTRVIGQHKLQPWARDTVWDCRDPTDCRPVARSTRDTVFPGKRQIDRAAIRQVAALLGWHDHDIVDQIGEGGVEVRSDCALDIVLAFHHESLLQEVALAEKSVRDQLKEEWVAPPVRHLPFVPCRLQPRGVIMQSRSRLKEDGVTLEDYEKPRIITDTSYGGPDSVNAGVAGEDRAIALPSCQSLGRGWAICAAAHHTEPTAQAVGEGVGGYCVDAESAYSFCPVQTADLWTQCFCWWGEDGTAGFSCDYRMGFGGAFGPNRFERISTLAAAYAQHLHAAFDASQPTPPSAQVFTAHRRALQHLGKLPPGESQVHPRYIQVFIDDFTGTAGNDTVIPPTSVEHVVIDSRHMRAAGCNPAGPNTRVYVHAQLVVLALSHVGLYAAPHKVACGSPLPALGLLFDADASIIRCPSGKRAAVMAAVAEARDLAATEARVDLRKARRLVGRLNNLSQVAPGLRPRLHGGYSITEARFSRHGGQGQGSKGLSPGMARLRKDGTRQRDWIALLDFATQELGDNVGVRMAPRTLAPTRDTSGSLTTVTDASGEDGFGGYAFSADHPGVVFMMSALWSPRSMEALRASASVSEADLRRKGSTSAAEYLSMPAAELFAHVVLVAAVARTVTVDRVFAIGDCGPAIAAIDAAYSPNPQIRSLLAQASKAAPEWIGAKIPRTANVDADRLSHPSMFPVVRADAQLADLHVCEVFPSAADWDALHEAVAASADHPKGRHKKRGRPHA
jgi:hypothetical protein